MAGATDEPDDSLARCLRTDPHRAADRVVAEFRSRLVRLAEHLLDPRTRGLLDGEDVAQSALKSFFRQQATEALPVGSRIELWHLLAVIARRKCVRAARRTLAQKRGGGRNRIVSPAADDSADEWDLADPDAVPPEAVAVMADLHQLLLAGLDDLHRPVCELRLDGHEVDEIAGRLHVSLRTIERRLARIRTRLGALEVDE